MDKYYFELLPLRVKPKEDESYTSLVTRLGERNRVKTYAVMKGLLFPTHHYQMIQKSADNPILRVYKFSAITNISEAEVLQTTFYYLAQNFGRSTFPPRVGRFLSGTVAKVLRYCPQCLAEDPYYRLSWRFKHISACQKHKRFLLDRCGNCGRDIPLVAMPLKMAICPLCGIQLWKLPPGNLTTQQTTFEEQYAALKILLHPIIDWHRYEHTNLTKLIGSRIRDFRIALNISRKIASTSLNIAMDKVSCIETGDQIRANLSFRMYLTYLDLLGINMYDILRRPAPPQEKRVPPKKSSKHIGKLEFLYKEEQYVRQVKQAISDLSSAQKMVSINAISKMLHLTAATLYRYPRVRELLPAWQAKKALYEHRAAQRLTQVKIIYEDFCRDGKIPSMKDIEKAMKITLDRSPEIKEWLWSKRIESQRKLEDTLLERIDIVVGQLNIQGKSPTNEQLSRELQVPRHLFDRPRVRQKLRYIRQSLRVQFSREEDLLLRIQEAREKSRLQGVKETQAEIARRVGLSVSGLRKYPRIKPIMIEIAKISKRKALH